MSHVTRHTSHSSYHRILSKMLFEPWFITPAKYSSMMQQLRARLDHPSSLTSDLRPLASADIDEDDAMELPESRPGMDTGSGIALLSIAGIIGKRLSWLEMMCGGCDLDIVCEMITEADEDADIHTIILDFHSPGGLYTGLPEAADLIASVAKNKTVISFTDTECCSAAYWLGSQAGEFYCTRSATVGSIGGFIAGVDTSKEWENIGWALELFKSGKLKAMGLDGKKWEDPEREFLQALVDKECAEFRATVQRARPPLAADTMQGQYFDGDQALSLGLVDKNVANLQEVITRSLNDHYSHAVAIAEASLS